MAYIREHMEDYEHHLGKPYKKVHLWLDEFVKVFDVGTFSEYHRTFRHNSYGLRCIEAMWGYGAEKAARIHLIRDYLHREINNDKTLRYHITGKGFNKMMVWFDNPVNMEPIMHWSVIYSWINEGIGLVTLATKNKAEYK